MGAALTRAELRQIATAEIDNWRGRCIQAFASVELVVNQTLQLMATDNRRGQAIELQPATGARHEEFLKAIGQDGPFAVEGRIAEKQFREWRALEAEYRNWIVHSWHRMIFDAKRNWVITGTFITVVKKQPQERPRQITKDEAMRLVGEIEAAAARVRSALGQIRRALRP